MAIPALQAFVGQVGPTTQADGNTPAIRLGRSAEVVVDELHGRFYETTYRGNTFTGGMQLTSISNATFGVAAATSATLATAAASTPIIGLWNPLASSVNAVLLQAQVSAINTALQVTGAGSLVWIVWPGQNAISTGSFGWSRKSLTVGGSQCKVLAGVALTGLTTIQSATTNIFATSVISPGAMSNLSTLQTAAGLMPVAAPGVENFDGSVIIPPGGLIGLYTSGTAVAISAASSLLWEEVLL